jgi:hypothetical protein
MPEYLTHTQPRELSRRRRIKSGLKGQRFSGDSHSGLCFLPNRTTNRANPHSPVARTFELKVSHATWNPIDRDPRVITVAIQLTGWF